MGCGASKDVVRQQTSEQNVVAPLALPNALDRMAAATALSAFTGGGGGESPRAIHRPEVQVRVMTTSLVPLYSLHAAY